MRIDHFNVNNGIVKGGGCDTVGEFVISGTHNRENNEIKFEKSYIGQHTV